MEKTKILVVDDESRMRVLIRDFLTKKDYEVLEAENGAMALQIFAEHPEIALILLDVMMPVMDGLHTLRVIRETSNVPIIMLTAKSEEQDALESFRLGVDEYVTKPFSPKVLVARVEALLRRSNPEEPERKELNLSGIRIDYPAREAYVDGVRLDLSFKEYELLVYFLENRGIALSREMILNHVWNYDYYGDARTIDTHVKKLRSKMGAKGDCIKTVWGLGYKFEE